MATPTIRSNGSVSGVVTGEGRNDLDIAETVTLTDANPSNSGASYQWSFESRPPGSSATITNPNSASASFVPDVTGSYRIRCLVNGVDPDSEVLAVPLPNTGARMPSFRERLEYTGGGNTEGWHTALIHFMRQVDSMIGGGSGNYQTVHNPAGTPVTQRAVLAFTSTFSVTDVSSRTVVEIATGGITLPMHATQAALSVVANATNSTASPTAVAAGTDHFVFRRSGTALGWGLLVNANIDPAAAVAHSKLADLAGASVLGRSAATSGAMAAITGATPGHVLTVQGDNTLAFSAAAASGYTTIHNPSGTPITQRAVLAFSTAFSVADDSGTSRTLVALANNGVSDAVLRDSAALSVIGRSANSSGDPADITFGTDGFVLRRSGTTLGAGTLAAGAFADGTITGARLTGFTDTTIPVANSSGQLVSSTVTIVTTVLTHAASASTGNVHMLVSNTSNTGSSAATVEARVAGASAGNPSFILNVNGVQTYTSRVLTSTPRWEFLEGANVRMFTQNQGITIGGQTPSPAETNSSLFVTARAAGGDTLMEVQNAASTNKVVLNITQRNATGAISLTAWGTSTSDTVFADNAAGMHAITSGKDFRIGTTANEAVTIGANSNKRLRVDPAGFLDVYGASAPGSSPASNNNRLFSDTADGRMKVRDSAGVVTILN